MFTHPQASLQFLKPGVSLSAQEAFSISVTNEILLSISSFTLKKGTTIAVHMTKGEPKEKGNRRRGENNSGT